MRYKVIERRCYHAEYVIEAANEKAAGGLDGEIISEDHTDCWGDDLVSVELLDDETDESALPAEECFDGSSQYDRDTGDEVPR
jgi:hypothetical protein